MKYVDTNILIRFIIDDNKELADIAEHILKTNEYSPSQYWYDLDRTDRRTVSTSMSVGLRGNTIVISLSYA